MLKVDYLEIKKLCEKYGIRYLALFGSHARGEGIEDSDVDLLYEYSIDSSVFGLEHIGVIKSFEKLFDKRVDMVSKGNIDPYIRPFVSKDLQVLYEDDK